MHPNYKVYYFTDLCLSFLNMTGSIQCRLGQDQTYTTQTNVNKPQCLLFAIKMRRNWMRRDNWKLFQTETILLITVRIIIGHIQGFVYIHKISRCAP